MAGLFHGKKNEYFGACTNVSVCLFYFLIKKHFIDFREKKKHKPMSQIIEQGLVFNLNVNAIVLGKED